MQKVVYELTKKPPMIGRHRHTHKRLTPSPLKYLKLIDDVVCKRDGDDEERSHTICVASGESSVFLKDHSDTSRHKKSIQRLEISGMHVVIDQNVRQHPEIIKFLALSNKSNLKGNNRPMLRKVEMAKRAQEIYQNDKNYIEAKSFVYNQENWGAVKAYVVSNNLMNLEDIAELGKDVAISKLASKITQSNAESILEELKSELLMRKYEMIQAKESGKIKIDYRSKNITYGDTNSILTSFEGSDPITAAARYTMKSEGSRAYAFIVDGLTDVGEIDDVGETDVDSDSLETLINKAIRLDVFEKGKRGYRFENVLIGGEKEKMVDHFNRYPEKIDKLRDALRK